MRRYILKRFLLLIFLLAAVSTAVFFLVHFIPGDPAVSILGTGADSEDIQRVRGRLNLDKPLPQQYLKFLGNLANFSFGRSLIDGQPVNNSILSVMPNTVSLASVSMLLALLISFPLGAWAAFKENTKIDAAITLISSMGLAIPNFVLGPLLIIIFSVALGWLPVSGSGGFQYIILPAITLAVSISAFLTRIIKTSLVTELQKPYVLLARAKGLTEPQLFKRHLLKNAMIPIVTTIGLQLGALLTGAVITETIFSWQGIGSLLINAIRQRDYPMVQGIVVFITFVYLILSFIVDICYFMMDPRIRHEIETR
ncbi:MAG: ABC transporter permease [bacterium]|nr:ABC transporter permease [bacterium]